MATGSQNMTTYLAKQIIGSNAAANPAGALLLSGKGRADNATGDTWLFLDSVGGTDTPWGIKHDQANNKIHIYGSNIDSVWTRMNTGDTYILGKVGIGYNPETSGNSYKLYVNGGSYFIDTITGDATSAWHILGGRPANTTNFNTHFETVGNLHHDNPARTDVELTYNRFFLSHSDQTTYGPSALHLPVVDQHVLSFGVDNGATYSRHMAFDIRTNAVYVRARTNNTWGNWEELVRNTGTWGISITGNAATATTASYANVLNNDGGRRASSEYMHADGKLRFYLATSSMTTGKPPTGDGFILKGGWDNAGGWDAMISWSNGGHMSVRGSSGSGNATAHTQAWQAWNTILDSNNYTSYTVTKTGSGASGSWAISVTGSSASCTGNSDTANYQNCVATNEIRYARNGNMKSANDLWQGWAFAEGKVAVINGWRFGNGNGGLAPIYGSKVYNAVWNDFAEYRVSDITEGGRVLVSDGKGHLVLSTERLQPSARVISDTFGCSVGMSDNAKTPIGVAGRVLVYPYQPRENYKVGDALCAAPEGTADIMTREEIIQYPDRIIGIVDEIPDYEIWDQVHTNKKDDGEVGEQNHTNIKVNGRIWIYVR